MAEQPDIIDTLIQMQAVMGTEGQRVTDAEFAAHLGVSRAQWNNLRRRRYPLGKRTATQIVARYPQLRGAVATALFLQGSAKTHEKRREM